MLANHLFWRLMLFYAHLLLLLQPSVLWLSIVTFDDAKPAPKLIVREFDVLRLRPRLGWLPNLEKFTRQNLSPTERVTQSGRPDYPAYNLVPRVLSYPLYGA